MVVDEDSFPPIAIVNTSAIEDLKESLATEKAREKIPIPKVNHVQVLKKCLYPIKNQLHL